MMNNHHHIANQNSSNDPRRRQNLVVLGGGRGLALTPQQPSQIQQQRPPVQVQRQTFWTCDICQVAKFQDYNEACRHEALCQSIQDNLKKAAALEKRAKQHQQQQQQQRRLIQPLQPPPVMAQPVITTKPSSSPSRQSTPRKQQQEASPKKSKIWTCDVCLVAQFNTYKEASKHEQNCKPPDRKKKNPKIVWNCDVCKIAQFDTFEEAQAHESQCKERQENTQKTQQLQKQQRITWTCDVCKVAEFEDFDEACRHEKECGNMNFEQDEEKHFLLEQTIDEIANGTQSTLTRKKKKNKRKNIQVPIFDHVLLLAGKTKSHREQKSRAAKDRKKTYDEDYSSDGSFSSSSSSSSLEDNVFEERENDEPILDMSIMTSLKDYIGGRKCGSTDSESDAPSIIPPELILPTTSLKENYQEWFYESESEDSFSGEDSEASSVQKSPRRTTNRMNPTNVKKEKQSIWV